MGFLSGHTRKRLIRTISPRKNTASSTFNDVPRGHFPVYVGENLQRRFVIPICYLNHPLFRELLRLAEEEFGYEHPINGGLTIPCSEDYFLNLTSQLRSWQMTESF
ncbi:SAUR-like auxin-responsive protein family [Striga hermonthica]|uniref:SAUR-like auxin-responsive protein family n=1 Tax=Striga hermonthica TaxID=68872 RepID=A0A9N7MIZ1_STRHE|nr:SAUR-like auxin-responsive protein family [Striga hermonthica]